MDVRVLIVDPESNLRLLLQYGLQRYGYANLATASTANSAVDLLRERPTPVVFLNRAVPDMTPAEFAAACRALDPHTAIIVLSWETRFPEAREWIRNQEVTDCLWVNPQELENVPLAVERALIWRRMSQANARLQTLLEEQWRGVELLPCEERETLNGLVRIP